MMIIVNFRFYLYKLPHGYASTKVTEGLKFLYITANMNDWKLSEKTVKDQDSIVGHTVSQAYFNMVINYYFFLNRNLNSVFI